MNTTLQPPTPTAVITTAPKLTTAEARQIEATKHEITRLDALLDQVANLRSVLEQAGSHFAAGRIDLLTAASVICASPEQRAQMQDGLRRPLKLAISRALAEVQPIIDKARAHAAEELRDKCRTMEGAERANAAAIGISADDYRPSGMLESLREQHRRVKCRVGEPVTRGDLQAL